MKYIVFVLMVKTTLNIKNENVPAQRADFLNNIVIKKMSQKSLAIYNTSLK